MELILAVLVAGPVGFFSRTYRRGLVAYVASWAIVLPIQTIVVFSDGDGDISYWFVNAAILAAGIGLNRLGHVLGHRRRQRVLHA